MRTIIALLVIYASVSAVTMDDIKQKLAANSGKVSSMRCFMETSVDLMGQSFKQKAKVLIKEPNMTKIHMYAPPMEQVITSDGKLICIEIPSMNQKVNKKFDENAEELSILPGNETQEYFDNNHFEVKSDLGEGWYLLEGVPSNSDASGDMGTGESIAKLEMKFNYNHGTVNSIKLYNDQNNLIGTVTLEYSEIQGIWVVVSMQTVLSADGSNMKTQVRFTDLHINENLPDKLFQINGE